MRASKLSTWTNELDELPAEHRLTIESAPCPSGEGQCESRVYEMVGDGEGRRLHLNFSNCVHCKICDIADPYGVIYWTTPEGGDGPRYKAT